MANPPLLWDDVDQKRTNAVTQKFHQSEISAWEQIMLLCPFAARSAIQAAITSDQIVTADQLPM
jgi:hypothetical protein